MLNVETLPTTPANQKSDLADQTLDLAGQTSDLADHTSDLTDHISDLASQTSELANHTFDLANHTSDLADQTSDLAKHTFTLKEWSEWVEAHPEFLEIKSTKAVCMSLTRGIDNLKEYMSPLTILQKRLDRENIVKNQKKQFPDIYTECLASENFEIKRKSNNATLTYKLITDMLMVYVEDEPKILIPPNLVGALLAFFHLKGHGGIKRMVSDLKSYYFQNM